MPWWLLVVVLVACVDDRRLSGPVFDVHVERRDFPLPVRKEIDLLFVVDATREVKTKLRNNTSGFIGQLLSGAPREFQIGFITTDVACSGSDAGVVHAASANGRFLVDESDGSIRELETGFAASIDALVEPRCPSSRPFEAIVRALLHPANAGFPRAGAQLAIVMITEGDDASWLLVDTVASTIKATKRDSSSITVAGAFGPCPRDDHRAIPPRIDELLQQFPNRNTAVSLCQEDLSGAVGFVRFDESWTSIGNPCIAVTLTDPPECISSFTRDGIEQLVPSCDLDSSTVCWSIVTDANQCPGGSNQLVLIDHYVPTTSPARARFECVVPSNGML